MRFQKSRDARRLDVFEVFVNILQRAVRADQINRGFLADAGNARNVIRRIAAQAFVIGHEERPETIFCLHRARRKNVEIGNAASREQYLNSLIDKLQRVAVASHNRHVQVVAQTKLRQRAQNVVAFVTALLVMRDAQTIEQIARGAALNLQVVRRSGAIGFIFGEVVVTKSRAARIQRDEGIFRLIFIEQAQEHAHETVKRAGWHTFARGQRRAGKKRAIQQRISVNEKQFHGEKSLHRSNKKRTRQSVPFCNEVVQHRVLDVAADE